MNTQEFWNIHKKKIAIIAGVSVAVLILVIGVVFFFVNGKVNPVEGQAVLTGEKGSSGILSFSGTTIMESNQVKLDVEGLSEGLLVEKVYIEPGTELQEGNMILKFTEESLAFAREELEQAKREAEMAFHAEEIKYEQSKITLRYDKERAVLEGEQAKDEYNETVAELDERVKQAQQALNEAKTQISEYEKIIEVKSSQDPFKVKAYKKVYDDNLALLTKQIDQNGFTWEQVVNGSEADITDGQIYVLQRFYKVLEQNLADYKQAQADYDDAVADATLNLQTLKLSLSALEAELSEAQADYETDVRLAKLTMEQKQADAEHAQADYVAKLEQAQADYEDKKKAKEAAEERLTKLAQRVGAGYFYASYSGSVLQVMAAEGEYLTAGSRILEYSNQEMLTVSFPVEQTNIAAIAVGDTAYIKAEEGGSFQGTVIEMNPIPKSDESTGITYEVKVALGEEAEQLEADETVTVMFRIGGTSDEEAN